ncbi:MAG TPA: Crp/Fnr family transcriptional regulator [Terracidiphilus sp.]|nr:Crp/Fnr family transcriptional regulator [Terracidiphilus sp.]
MLTQAGFRALTAAAHPLAELLACPPQAGDLLSGASQILHFEAAYVVFRQHEPCKGLYLLASGSFARSAVRLNTRLALGTARSGELVELAAALGDGRHTYTLTAVSAGSLLMLPMATLSRAFDVHPPLRMHLLEELAREVSRAYTLCFLNRMGARTRRRQANSM